MNNPQPHNVYCTIVLFLPTAPYTQLNLLKIISSDAETAAETIRSMHVWTQ